MVPSGRLYHYQKDYTLIIRVVHVILDPDTPWYKDSLENNIARISRLNIDGVEKERILGSNIIDMLKL